MTAPAATWQSFLAERRTVLVSQSEAAAEITTETQFRKECDTYLKQNQRILTNLKRLPLSIADLAKAIDTAAQFTSPNSLTSLVWGSAYAVFEAGLRHRVDLDDFGKTLRADKPSIPKFAANIEKHIDVPTVRKPLQDIFAEYLDCHTEMISYFATHPTSFEPFVSRFTSASAFFAKAREEWQGALEEADREEQEHFSHRSVPEGVVNGGSARAFEAENTNVHFQFVRQLGQGTYGNVAEVRERTSKKYYARKLVPVKDPRVREFFEEQVKSEVAIMQKLQHPHIAQVLLYTRDSDALSIFMLPVADYDLRHHLEEVCNKDGEEASLYRMDTWFGCLVSALAYAHNCKIKHHDIKPSNILIKNKQPLLADFGSAKDFSHLDTSWDQGDSVAGTPVYYPPEPLPWGRSADVFALGCVFSEMLTVRCGKSLPEYRQYRHKNVVNGYAFKENLHKVEDWIHDLDTMNQKASEALNLVSDQTLKMLAGSVEQRVEMKSVKRAFRVEHDALFCENCG